MTEKKRKIYVADDEKNICFLIRNFLEKEGFEVVYLQPDHAGWIFWYWIL